MDRTARLEPGPTRRSYRRAVLVALVALVATGCEIDVGVGLDVADDGSGEVEVEVTLDPNAAGRVSDLAGQLRVDDLVGAGWVVEGPSPRPDGSVVVAATKPFARVEEAGAVMEEVSGAEGPFRGFRVRRERSFLSTTYRFEGEVDLIAGIEGFSDEELARRLEGSGFGLGTAEVERLTGAPVGETFHFEVRTRLPGALLEGPATSTGDEARWRPPVGESTTLVATARQLHAASLAWLLAAALAAAGVAVVLVTQRSRRP